MHEVALPLLPTDDEMREALSRLLESRQLCRAPRLRQLLEFLGRATLAADTRALKEQSVGVHVFGRKADYNHADDNIVRVSVRQLRAKIEEYYQTEGRNQQWEVAIPKGCYALTFKKRSGPELAEAIPRLAQAAPSKAARWLPWALVVVLFGAVMGLLLEIPAGQAVSPPEAEKSLLGLLAPHSGQKLNVVVEDSGLQIFHQLTARNVPLGNYLGLKFLDPGNLAPEQLKNSQIYRFLSQTETTGFWCVSVVSDLARANPSMQFSVRDPRSLTTRDFESDNVLLLGGPFANPWVQLFDAPLNFQIRSIPGKGKYVSNSSQRPGERAVYTNTTDHSGVTICYARIAYVPNLTGKGRVLLAGGPHEASSEAAAKFISTGDGLRQVLDLFQVPSRDRLPWFELLIEARAVGSSADAMRLVASRKIAANQFNLLKSEDTSQGK